MTNNAQKKKNTVRGWIVYINLNKIDIHCVS